MVQRRAGFSHHTTTARLPHARRAVCQTVLQGPAAAAHAAAAASNKNRSAAEDAIARSVADALHLVAALRQAMHLMAPGAVRQVRARGGCRDGACGAGNPGCR
jgi:hypothetical protein